MKYFKKMYIIYLTLFCYGISIILFFVTSRYRIPAIPYFVIFSSAAIYEFTQRVREKRWSSLFGWAIILIIAVIVTNIPIASRGIDPAVAHYNYGTILQNQGRLREAGREYETAISIYPFWWRPYLYLGDIYAQKKDPDRARIIWSKVLMLDKDNKDAIDRINSLDEK